MHYRANIIGTVHDCWMVVADNIEIKVIFLRNVFSMDVNIIVSVWSTLLMPKSQSVHQLMHNYPVTKASISKGYSVWIIWIICIWIVVVSYATCKAAVSFENL